MRTIPSESMRLRAMLRSVVGALGEPHSDLPLGDFATLDGRAEVAFRKRVEKRLDLLLPVRRLGSAQARHVVDEPAPEGVSRKTCSRRESTKPHLQNKYWYTGLSSTDAGSHAYPSNWWSFLSLFPPKRPPKRPLLVGAGATVVGLEFGPLACGANGGPYLARVPI